MVGTMEEERFARLNHRDSETSLDPTHFRMYSSSVGRWMTPDPAGRRAANPRRPQSWNRYAYALNNSTTLTDPLGLETSPCMIDGQPGFCTTVNVSGGIDMSQLPSLPTMAQDAMVGPATALWGDYITTTQPLNPFATAVFSQVGQDTAFLLNPWFYGAFYGGSALVGAAADVLPYVANGQATAAASAWMETALPGSTGVLTDFVSGLGGTVTTGSKANMLGYFIGNLLP
jgi:RHS repeat-associated protein